MTINHYRGGSRGYTISIGDGKPTVTPDIEGLHEAINHYFGHKHNPRVLTCPLCLAAQYEEAKVQGH